MRILKDPLIVLFLLGGLGWISEKLEIKWVDKEESKTASEEKTPRNYDKLSAEELQPLAEKGDAEAQHNLGVMYRQGEVLPKDFQLAVKWFRKAAEQGNASAQYQLGGMYYFGEGVPKDHVLAYKWFTQGDEDAPKYRDELAKK